MTDDLEPTTREPLEDAEGIDEPEPDLEASPKNDPVEEEGN